ncbi:MAG: hypothetical protein E6670_03245 [Veillonella parvula]|nr:hypothetical protein [Veillonella parvula]
MRKHIKNNVSWVGKIDWELQEFHGSDYTINNGSSQNAYLIEEEKTVLIDTVWKPHSSEFIDNLESEINLNTIDCPWLDNIIILNGTLKPLKQGTP